MFTISKLASDGKQPSVEIFATKPFYSIFKSNIPAEILSSCPFLKWNLACGFLSEEPPIITVYETLATYGNICILVIRLDFQAATFDLVRAPIVLPTKSLTDYKFREKLFYVADNSCLHIYTFNEDWQLVEAAAYESPSDPFRFYSCRGLYFCCSRLWIYNCNIDSFTSSSLRSIKYFELGNPERHTIDLAPLPDAFDEFECRRRKKLARKVSVLGRVMLFIRLLD